MGRLLRGRVVARVVARPPGSHVNTIHSPARRGNLLGNNTTGRARVTTSPALPGPRSPMPSSAAVARPSAGSASPTAAYRVATTRPGGPAATRPPSSTGCHRRLRQHCPPQWPRPSHVPQRNGLARPPAGPPGRRPRPRHPNPNNTFVNTALAKRLAEDAEAQDEGGRGPAFHARGQGYKHTSFCLPECWSRLQPQKIPPPTLHPKLPTSLA